MIFVWADSDLRDDWRGSQWIGWGAFVIGVIAIILGAHYLSWLRTPSISAITSLAHLTSTDCRPEMFIVEAIIVAELELCNVQLLVLFAALWKVMPAQKRQR